VLLVFGIVALLISKKSKWDHTRAEAMRSKVEQELPELRKREASALETEAQAERARADAERLEAQASERRSEVEDQRSALNEQLRAADERDPLVNNETDDHRHVDDASRRD
jgi:hypothetical protein